MTYEIFAHFPPLTKRTETCCTLSGYKRAPGRARLGKWGGCMKRITINEPISVHPTMTLPMPQCHAIRLGKKEREGN